MLLIIIARIIYLRMKIRIPAPAERDAGPAEERDGGRGGRRVNIMEQETQMVALAERASHYFDGSFVVRWNAAPNYVGIH